MPRPKPKRFARLVPGIVGGVIVLGVVAGLVWLVSSWMQKPDEPTRAVAQVVQLVRPPPPPDQPPPPPPPPPEEKIDEPLPQDAPEDSPPDDAPSAEQLGLDAEGVAGSDGFGLAARRGGRDIVGGGGSAFAWYTTLIKDSILDRLSEDERVRKGSYQVTVRVWLATDGRVERIALTQSTGNRDLDGAIEQALRQLARMRDAPPLEMPQPVTLRIVSRG